MHAVDRLCRTPFPSSVRPPFGIEQLAVQRWLQRLFIVLGSWSLLALFGSAAVRGQHSERRRDQFAAGRRRVAAVVASTSGFSAGAHTARLAAPAVSAADNHAGAVKPPEDAVVALAPTPVTRSASTRRPGPVHFALEYFRAEHTLYEYGATDPNDSTIVYIK